MRSGSAIPSGPIKASVIFMRNKKKSENMEDKSQPDIFGINPKPDKRPSEKAIEQVRREKEAERKAKQQPAEK